MANNIPTFVTTHGFEALKLRYEDQTNQLREMTRSELQIFSGILTLQVILGGWIAVHPISDFVTSVGVGISDFFVAAMALYLLHGFYTYRVTVVQTIINLNTALGFYDSNYYMVDAINPPATNPNEPYWPFWFGYAGGILAAVVGVFVVLFGKAIWGH